MMVESDDYPAVSLLRVFSENLDPSRDWYLLNKKICMKPSRKFRENSIFVEFKEEIQSISLRELKDSEGQPLPQTAWPQRSKDWLSLCCVSIRTFVWPLRQQRQGLLRDMPFIAVAAQEVNIINLFGAKTGQGKSLFTNDFVPMLSSTPDPVVQKPDINTPSDCSSSGSDNSGNFFSLFQLMTECFPLQRSEGSKNYLVRSSPKYRPPVNEMERVLELFWLKDVSEIP